MLPAFNRKTETRALDRLDVENDLDIFSRAAVYWTILIFSLRAQRCFTPYTDRATPNLLI